MKIYTEFFSRIYKYIILMLGMSMSFFSNCRFNVRHILMKSFILTCQNDFTQMQCETFGSNRPSKIERAKLINDREIGQNYLNINLLLAVFYKRFNSLCIPVRYVRPNSFEHQLESIHSSLLTAMHNTQFATIS